MSLQSDSAEVLWRQYNLHVDLYKFYLEIVVKMNLFYYAVTGGIVSFYLTKATIPAVKYSLLLPVLMSFAFFALFAVGAYLITITRKELFAIRDKLGLQTAPEIGVLALTLGLFSAIFFSVGIGLICLMRMT